MNHLNEPAYASHEEGGEDVDSKGSGHLLLRFRPFYEMKVMFEQFNFYHLVTSSRMSTE